jgi:hypothetical protein
VVRGDGEVPRQRDETDRWIRGQGLTRSCDEAAAGRRRRRSSRCDTLRPAPPENTRDEIVIAGTTNDGRPKRWIWSELTPRSARWRDEVTPDHGATWVMREEMRLRRI